MKVVSRLWALNERESCKYILEFNKGIIGFLSWGLKIKIRFSIPSLQLQIKKSFSLKMIQNLGDNKNPSWEKAMSSTPHCQLCVCKKWILKLKSGFLQDYLVLSQLQEELWVSPAGGKQPASGVLVMILRASSALPLVTFLCSPVDRLWYPGQRASPALLNLLNGKGIWLHSPPWRSTCINVLISLGSQWSLFPSPAKEAQAKEAWTGIWKPLLNENRLLLPPSPAGSLWAAGRRKASPEAKSTTESCRWGEA